MLNDTVRELRPEFDWVFATPARGLMPYRIGQAYRAAEDLIACEEWPLA